MTGFIFTCSLLCTAALQADPAVLQRAETNVMRHILEAVIPVVPAPTAGAQRESGRSGCCGTVVRMPAPGDTAPRRTVLSRNPVCGRSQFVRMHPIRAPAGA